MGVLDIVPDRVGALLAAGARGARRCGHDARHPPISWRLPRLVLNDGREPTGFTYVSGIATIGPDDTRRLTVFVR